MVLHRSSTPRLNFNTRKTLVGRVSRHFPWAKLSSKKPRRMDPVLKNMVPGPEGLQEASSSPMYTSPSLKNKSPTNYFPR